MGEAQTLVDTLARVVDAAPEAVCFFDETDDGRYVPVTRRAFWNDVHRAAEALAGLGVGRGDRVGVIMRPRSAWEVVDKAIVFLGAITVGLDYKSSPDDLEYVLRSAEVRVLVAEDRAHLELVPEAARAALEHRILVDDDAPAPGTTLDFGATGTADDTLSLTRLLEHSVAGPPPTAARPEDVAVLIFTSGTTSRPKGIPLTHAQLVAGVPIMREVFAAELSGENRTLAWIPLYNGTGRMMGSLNFALGVAQYFVRDPMTLFDRVKVVRPTYLVLMPRILEKVHQQLMAGLAARPAHVRILVSALMALRRRLPVAPVHALTDRLLVRRIREAVWGDSMKFLVSGSAPVDPRILGDFDALGTPTYEVYGMSELAVLISMNRPGAIAYGSVGRLLPGMEVKIADDGEILVRSAAQLSGYWGETDPGDTTDADGFLKTGDLGEFRGGFLYITGRKKEIIKTSTGQRISPVAVENVYRDVPGVESIIVVGNARKYLTALVVLDADFRSRLESEGRAAADYLAAEFEKRHARLGANRQVKRFAVLDEPFSLERGEITSTLKFRRATIEKNYNALIDGLYA